MDTEINTLRQVLMDESQAGFWQQLWQILMDESQAGFSQPGFWRRREAASHLSQLATRSDRRGTRFNPADARALIEALVAGLESIHWGIHLICRRALERLKDQQLIEAVCELIIERDLPRLRILAVHRRYYSQDPVRQAAYLFTSGQLQRYEAHDPEGALLEQFYAEAPQEVRERILGLARSWGRSSLGEAGYNAPS
jgi:hypothetical protein